MTLIGRAKNLIGSYSGKNEGSVVNMHVSNLSNEWNMLAIQFLYEEMKLPTQRKQVCIYPNLQIKKVSTVISSMTTDEWNRLALSLAGKMKEKEVVNVSD